MPQITASKTIVASSQIAPGIIVDSDVNASAAIAVSKLAALTVSSLVKTDASGFLTVGTATPAQGGTGLTTLTANNLLVGAGTSNVTFIAPGSNGQVLKSNGTTWAAGNSSAGGIFLTLREADANASEVLKNSCLVTRYNDAVTAHASCSFYFPVGVTISTAKLLLYPRQGTSYDVVFNIKFWSFVDAAGMVNDDGTGNVTITINNANTDGSTAYSLAGTAFDGLTAGRRYLVDVARIGADAADTANGEQDVYGLEIVFA